MIKFECQSCRICSIIGVAFASARMQLAKSAVCVKVKGRAKAFVAGKFTAVLCICKLLHYHPRLAD